MKKKNIVITGGLSGFGLEEAKLFAADGHNLILLDRNISNKNKIGLPDALVLKVDVTNFKEFNAAVQKGVKKFGPIDLLVNNAGTMIIGEMASQSLDLMNTMVDVNLKGTINGIKTVIKSMKKRKTGTIINMSSIAALRTGGNLSVYAAAKAGVKALTADVRFELAPYGVRVANVNPGGFKTNLLNHTKDKALTKGIASAFESWGKMAEPIELAKLIQYMYYAPQELNIAEVTLYTTAQGK